MMLTMALGHHHNRALACRSVRDAGADALCAATDQHNPVAQKLTVHTESDPFSRDQGASLRWPRPPGWRTRLPSVTPRSTIADRRWSVSSRPGGAKEGFWPTFGDEGPFMIDSDSGLT
jgi:hypothetical protein